MIYFRSFCFCYGVFLVVSLLFSVVVFFQSCFFVVKFLLTLFYCALWAYVSCHVYFSVLFQKELSKRMQALQRSRDT